MHGYFKNDARLRATLTAAGMQTLLAELREIRGAVKDANRLTDEILNQLLARYGMSIETAKSNAEREHAEANQKALTKSLPSKSSKRSKIAGAVIATFLLLALVIGVSKDVGGTIARSVMGERSCPSEQQITPKSTSPVESKSLDEFGLRLPAEDHAQTPTACVVVSSGVHQYVYAHTVAENDFAAARMIRDGRALNFAEMMKGLEPHSEQYSSMARAFEASYALADAYIKEDTRIAKAISDLKVREKTRLRPISAPVDPENARQLAKDIADSVEIWCAEASKKLAVADPKQSK